MYKTVECRTIDVFTLYIGFEVTQSPHRQLFWFAYCLGLSSHSHWHLEIDCMAVPHLPGRIDLLLCMDLVAAHHRMHLNTKYNGHYEKTTPSMRRGFNASRIRYRNYHWVTLCPWCSYHVSSHRSLCMDPDSACSVLLTFSSLMHRYTPSSG